MQIIREIPQTTQIKYLPIYKKGEMIYTLVTQTADLKHLTITGASVPIHPICSLEQVTKEEYGRPMMWKWSLLTSTHLVDQKEPIVPIVMEYLDLETVGACLQFNPKLQEVPLGKVDYTPNIASGILKFFYKFFGGHNGRVRTLYEALKVYDVSG